MKPRLVLPIVLLALLGLAAPSWAVVVSFEVADGSGRPVPGATINVGGRDVGTTGDDGKASADVDVQSGARQQVVVRVGDRVVFQGTREIRAGAPNRIEIPGAGSPSPGRDGRVADPGARRSWSMYDDWSPDRRVTIGAYVYNQGIDTHLGSQRFDVVTTLNGNVLTTLSMSGTLTPQQLDESRQKESKRHKIGAAVGPAVHIPLPGFGGGSLARLSPGSDSARWTASVPASGASEAAGGWRLSPALMLAASRADVELEFRNLTDPALSQGVSGNGVMLSGGLNALVSPGGDSPWFGTVAYAYSRTGTIDMTRTPALQTFAPAGAQVIKDEIRYQVRSHSARATVGYAFERVAPWAGVRFTSWSAKLDFDIRTDFSGRFNRPLEVTEAYRNTFKESLVEAVAGTDVRLARTPLVLRVEGSTDGDNHQLSFGVAVGLGR
jgi:hypothetical protein